MSSYVFIIIIYYQLLSSIIHLVSQILKAPGMVSLADSVSAGGREEQQGHETLIFYFCGGAPMKSQQIEWFRGTMGYPYFRKHPHGGAPKSSIYRWDLFTMHHPFWGTMGYPWVPKMSILGFHHSWVDGLIATPNLDSALGGIWEYLYGFLWFLVTRCCTCCSPDASWGLLDFLCFYMFFHVFLCFYMFLYVFKIFLKYGYMIFIYFYHQFIIIFCHILSYFVRALLLLLLRCSSPDLNCQLPSQVGIAGPQRPAPKPSGHRGTSQGHDKTWKSMKKAEKGEKLCQKECRNAIECNKIC